MFFLIIQIDDNITEDYRRKLIAASKMNTKFGKPKTADRSKVTTKDTSNKRSNKSKAPTSVVNFMNRMMKSVNKLKKDMDSLPERCAEVTRAASYIFIY